MKTSTITRTAKDGHKVSTTLSAVEFEEGREWFIGFDDSFTFRTKAEAEKNACNMLANMIQDYEYDNNLR